MTRREEQLDALARTAARLACARQTLLPVAADLATAAATDSVHATLARVRNDIDSLERAVAALTRARRTR